MAWVAFLGPDPTLLHVYCRSCNSFRRCQQGKEGRQPADNYPPCIQTIVPVVVFRMGLVCYPGGTSCLPVSKCSGAAFSDLSCRFSDYEEKLQVSADFHACNPFTD